MDSTSQSQDFKDGEKFIIFTYGTLKKGQTNYPKLNDTDLGSARFVGRGHTEEKYPLVTATQWEIPFLLQAPGLGNNVLGDIFEVDKKMLEFLDAFEGHPEVYQRERVSVAVDNYSEKTSEVSQRPLSCWGYFLNEFPEKFLNKTMLTSYDGTTERFLQINKEGLTGIESVQEALKNEWN